MGLGNFLYNQFNKDAFLKWRISFVLAEGFEFDYLMIDQVKRIEKILKQIHLYDYYDICRTASGKVKVKLKQEYHSEEQIENIVSMLKLMGLWDIDHD